MSSSGATAPRNCSATSWHICSYPVPSPSPAPIYAPLPPILQHGQDHAQLSDLVPARHFTTAVWALLHQYWPLGYQLPVPVWGEVDPSFHPRVLLELHLSPMGFRNPFFAHPSARTIWHWESPFVSPQTAPKYWCWNLLALCPTRFLHQCLSYQQWRSQFLLAPTIALVTEVGIILLSLTNPAFTQKWIRDAGGFTGVNPPMSKLAQGVYGTVQLRFDKFLRIGSLFIWKMVWIQFGKVFPSLHFFSIRSSRSCIILFRASFAISRRVIISTVSLSSLKTSFLDTSISNCSLLLW